MDKEFQEQYTIAKRLSIVVDPRVKAWIKEEAAKKKWTASFFCNELLREAMEEKCTKSN